MIAEGLLGRSLRTLKAGWERPAVSASPRRVRSTATRSRTHGQARLVLAVGVIIAILFGGWAWVRTSSLVAVRTVRVTGVAGPDAAQIRAALTVAARGMTTLDVRTDTLRQAVSPFSIVKALTVSGRLPHELRIQVSEQVPVAAVTIADQTVPVAADGTLLRDLTAGASLPQLTVKAAPGGERIAESSALEQLSVLGSAPYALLAKIASVQSDYWHGVVVQLRQGPALYFGDPSQLRMKWQTALGVLATPASAGAAYIDVSDPRRPAAGTSAAAAAAYDASAASATTAGGAGSASPAATLGGASVGASTGAGTTAAGTGATAGTAATAPGTGVTSTPPGG